MKAWLKGGLIGGIIGGLIPLVFSHPIRLLIKKNYNLLVFIYLPTALICKTGGDYSFPSFRCIILVYALYFFILGFIIGAIIGWIVGKRKSKKQQPIQTQSQVQTK